MKAETNQTETELSPEAVQPPEQEHRPEKQTEDKNEWEQKYQDLYDQYVRLAADFDNYRKRFNQEIEATRRYASENTLKELIPALDNLERATGSLSETSEPKLLYQSFRLMNNQIIDALAGVGLKRMETVGKPFDPNFHEAVTQVPSNDHPDQTVVNELQSGFMLQDRVLRPAMVAVSVKTENGAGDTAAGAGEANPFKNVSEDGNFKPE